MQTAIQIAQKLLPKRAKDALAKEGIDLGVLQEVAQKEGAKGTLIEIEDAKRRNCHIHGETNAWLDFKGPAGLEVALGA